jgi:hypothetical protein
MPTALATTAESPQSTITTLPPRCRRRPRQARAAVHVRSAFAVEYFVGQGRDLDAGGEQFLADAVGQGDGARGVAVQQHGVAVDGDVRAADAADDALGDHADRALGDLLVRVVDDRAGLGARHQRAVVAVGAVGDADDAHAQAAGAGGVGELAVLRQDDQRLVEGGDRVRDGAGVVGAVATRLPRRPCGATCRTRVPFATAKAWRAPIW